MSQTAAGIVWDHRPDMEQGVEEIAAGRVRVATS